MLTIDQFECPDWMHLNCETKQNGQYLLSFNKNFKVNVLTEYWLSITNSQIIYFTIIPIVINEYLKPMSYKKLICLCIWLKTNNIVYKEII